MSFFIIGPRFWIFDTKLQVTGPFQISDLGLSVTSIQAAFLWGTDKNKKTYLFRGTGYWRINTDTRRVESWHSRSMSDWRGVPPGISAAFQDEHGKIANKFLGINWWNWLPITTLIIEKKCSPNTYDFFCVPGFAYFLRGRYYWKFDPVQVKVMEGYPRLVSQDFFNCPAMSSSVNSLR